MSIYDWLLKVNTVDLATYGVAIASIDGNWDSPSAEYDEVVLPGRPGTARTTREPTTGALDLNVVAEISNTTEQGFEDYADGVKALLKSGDVTVIGGNQEARQRIGYVKGPIKILPDPADATHGSLRFTIHCEDPAAYSTTPTTVSGAAAADLAVAQGTYFTYPVITVTGPTSPLVITYKSYAGATVASLTVTFTGSPTTVVIDCANRTVTVDSVRHDEYLTAGDFFRLHPGDGDYSLSHWPTVRASSATGGTGVSIAYSKAYG